VKTTIVKTVYRYNVEIRILMTISLDENAKKTVPISMSRECTFLIVR